MLAYGHPSPLLLLDAPRLHRFHDLPTDLALLGSAEELYGPRTVMASSPDSIAALMIL